MSNYKKLRDVLRMHRKHYYGMLNENEDKISTYHKLKTTLENIDYNDVMNVDYMKLIRLKKYFPEQKEEMDTLVKLEKYKELIEAGNLKDFDFEEYDRLLFYSSNKFGVPPRDTLQQIKDSMEISKKMLKGDLNYRNQHALINNMPHSLRAYTHAICQLFAETLRLYLIKVLDDTYQLDLLETNSNSYREKIANVDKYYHMFSDTELLVKFEPNDLKEFDLFIKKLLDPKDYEQVMKDIKTDQEKEEVVIDNITFDNLDLSFFNEEELSIINEIREIIEDEVLEEKNNPFKDVEISLEVRNLYYKESSINDILLDVNYNLLNNIYDNKDEVIKIFRLIINKYRKYSLNVIRNEKIIELLKIKNDFNNIISFINKTFKNRELAYHNEKELTGYINDIDKDVIPIIKEMIDNDLDYDDYYDNEIDNTIIKYAKIIRKWKREMSLSYQEDSVVEEKENTNNLVFCITDIDLSTPGFDKEFKGTVESLEIKSAIELKKGFGRTSMSKLRKNSETGRSEDFVDYLEARRKSKIHFIPFRYSTEQNYRTGLVKFETSPKVKEFLEEHYGLSKQSVCYGIFLIITSIGADHTEYYYFQNYILNNCDYIEDIAKLLISDNPDYDKLVSIIDKFLLIKKNKLESIKNVLN